VLLVDFSPVVREGLRSILDWSGIFSVVGEAPDHDSAISMAAELRPAVVITELRAETIDGPELLEQLREEHPETVLFVLTESDRNSDITEAVAAGANGFMLVNKVDERTLPEAIHLAQTNTSALDSGVIRRILTQLKENARASLVTAGALSADLTDRELDVLRLLASGRTDREIAQRIGISVNTVNRHIRNIVDKLGAGNRTRAALLAAEAGLIEISAGGREESPSVVD
jgi:DNA-binding NarL/FixJ family response regulator